MGVHILPDLSIDFSAAWAPNAKNITIAAMYAVFFCITKVSSILLRVRP